MAMTDFPEMTPKAAAAFNSYVALGPSRTLRRLADCLVRQGLYKASSVAFRQSGTWSVRFSWQSRLSSAITVLTDARLEQAAEIDAGSFLKTSELIADRLDASAPHPLDDVLAIRQSVRKPSTKGPTVNVNLILSDLIAKYNLTEEEALAFDADLRAHLAATKAGVS